MYCYYVFLILGAVFCYILSNYFDVDFYVSNMVGLNMNVCCVTLCIHMLQYIVRLLSIYRHVFYVSSSGVCQIHHTYIAMFFAFIRYYFLQRL